MTELDIANNKQYKFLKDDKLCTFYHVWEEKTFIGYIGKYLNPFVGKTVGHKQFTREYWLMFLLNGAVLSGFSRHDVITQYSNRIK